MRTLDSGKAREKLVFRAKHLMQVFGLPADKVLHVLQKDDPELSFGYCTVIIADAKHLIKKLS